MNGKHWVLIIHKGRVTGRCSDGRTFGHPVPFPKVWADGFKTAAIMAGATVEIINE